MPKWARPFMDENRLIWTLWSDGCRYSKRRCDVTPEFDTARRMTAGFRGPRSTNQGVLAPPILPAGGIHSTDRATLDRARLICASKASNTLKVSAKFRP